MNNQTAHLHEVFSSIQGEGIYIGERQLFIRFSGCNLSCDYCDTRAALDLTPEFRLEQTPGQADFIKVKNPITAQKLIEMIGPLQKNKNLHSAVCITGGEPLLQINFLLGFLPELKKIEGSRIYLETNGTLPKHMDEIINYVDIVAMDIKLPSVTGQSSYMKEHQQFIEEVCFTGTNLFIKLPVNQQVKVKEIDEVSGIVAAVKPEIPLVIQPISPVKVKKEQLLSFQAVAKRKLADVRIIPQVQKQLSML